MLFNSYVFLLIFAPLVYGLYWLVTPRRLRLIFLTIASFLFYAYGNVGYLLLLVVIALQTWGMGLLVSRRRSGVLLAASVALVAAPLVITKYANFIASSLGAVLGQQWALPPIELPIGISFYTFQAMSYLADVYRGVIIAERTPLPVTAYLAFFPHLVAGPIVRYSDIGATLKNLPASISDEQRFQGLLLVVTGLARKVLIADELGVHVNRLLAVPEALDFWGAWGAMLGYSLQLSYDFSGYSQIAIGLAAWFGVPFPINFNRPYISRNISEFWTRWHISLSQWLRDYVYIPLGGNRAGRARTLFNLLITMFIGGLWHGAAWTFVLWGLYHGALLVLYHVTRPLNLIRWRVVSWALTFAAVVLGWVLFRSTSLEMAATLYRSMFGLSHFELLTAVPDMLGLRFLGILAVAFAVEFFLPERFEQRVRPRWIEAVGFTVLAVLVMLSIGTASQFLYFQF